MKMWISRTSAQNTISDKLFDISARQRARRQFVSERSDSTPGPFIAFCSLPLLKDAKGFPIGCRKMDKIEIDVKLTLQIPSVLNI